jgi:hypothetical protein
MLVDSRAKLGRDEVAAIYARLLITVGTSRRPYEEPRVYRSVRVTSRGYGLAILSEMAKAAFRVVLNSRFNAGNLGTDPTGSRGALYRL